MKLLDYVLRISDLEERRGIEKNGSFKISSNIIYITYLHFFI